MDHERFLCGHRPGIDCAQQTADPTKPCSRCRAAAKTRRIKRRLEEIASGYGNPEIPFVATGDIHWGLRLDSRGISGTHAVATPQPGKIVRSMLVHCGLHDAAAINDVNPDRLADRVVDKHGLRVQWGPIYHTDVGQFLSTNRRRRFRRTVRKVILSTAESIASEQVKHAARIAAQRDSCARKISFDSWGHAQGFARMRHETNHFGPMASYRCPVCHLWHNTSQVPADYWDTDNDSADTITSREQPDGINA